MRDFINSSRFKVILLIIVFLIGIMLYSVTHEGSPLPGSSLFHKVFNPAISAVNSVADTVEQGMKHFMNAEEYYEQNQKLKEEIAELNKELSNYEDDKRELEDLQQYLGIKDDHDDWVLSSPCTIISRVTNDPYHSFVINRGSDDGITVGDPVITTQGLCGMVVETTAYSAVVRTVLSSELSIGAICARTLDTGIIEGSLSTAEQDCTKMIYLSEGHSLKAGDIIRTNGVSGYFPEGCLIGKVLETGNEESGLSSYALIEPFVSFEEITGCMVVLDYKGKELRNETDHS